MTSIAETLAGLRVGPAAAYRNLTLFPLLDAQPPAEAGYLTLDEALLGELVQVTEVSESGVVPELRLRNAAGRPVLLVDGEELVGAKQNRVLNLSILVPAATDIRIPVSCVEAGRWAYRSARFASARRSHYASGRARRARSVTESMHRTGARISDQGEVWADIDEKMARMQVCSRTAAMGEIYEQSAARLEDYERAFAPLPGQVGVVVAINGRVRGLEFFDHPATFARLLPKLVGSYALDALDEGEHPGAAQDPPGEFLGGVAGAAAERFPALGEGEDLRFRDAGIAGGALVAEGRIVHLCAFAAAGGPERAAGAPPA